MDRTEAYCIIEEAVVQHIRAYGGGTAYFTAMDQWIRHYLFPFVQVLVPEVKPKSHVSLNVVVSGRFGRAFVNICNYLDITFDNLIILRGDLRGDEPADDLTYLGIHHQQPYEVYVFIDDTFYSGKTRKRVAAALGSIGARLACTRVVYDGCPAQAPDVESIFRYYDWEGRG